LNREVLKEDASNLIGLLCGRVHYAPEKWIAFDNDLLRHPWETGLVEVNFNQNSVVLHGPDFGKLTKWKNSKAHSWSAVGFPRAQLILQAQARVMYVLCEVVSQLVNNLPPSSRHDHVSLSDTQDEFAEFTEKHLRLIYPHSPLFDIEKLSVMADTRLIQSRDHLWQLQTDPLYMMRYMNLVDEGKYSTSADTGTLVKESIISMYVEHDTWVFRYWEWVVHEVEALKVRHR
jgi:hypothetical protein